MDKIKFVFTVDGDFPEYDKYKLPPKEKFIQYLENEIRFCKENLNGKYIHFIHFSPLAGFYFLEKEFISYYRKIENNGGNIGVHFHMDIPFKEYNLFKSKIGFIQEVLHRIKDNGLKPIAHRGGFFSYDSMITKILEEHKVFLEMSNVVGRKMVDNGKLVSDWTHSINRTYKLDYDNFLQEGNSNVWEIPVGNYKKKYLYLENIGMNELKDLLRNIKNNIEDRSGIQIFTVITHSYMFSPSKYNKYVRPFDGRHFSNRYLRYLFLIMKRIIDYCPLFDKMVKMKKYSWHSLYNHRKFTSIIEKIKTEHDFINGNECLGLLQHSEC